MAHKRKGHRHEGSTPSNDTGHIWATCAHAEDVDLGNLTRSMLRVQRADIAYWWRNKRKRALEDAMLLSKAVLVI
jgi:hypothetical protein